MATTQSFYLNDLELSINSTLATLGCVPTDPFTGIDAYAELDVSASVMQTLFQFHTDASDVDDIVADDLYFKVVYTDGQSYPLSTEFLANTDVITNMINANAAMNTVPYDYVRYLAQCLFNTYLGVDLFANESELRTDLDTTARAALDAKLGELAALGELNSTESSNPGFKILDQVKCNTPQRLSTIHLASGDANVNDGAYVWYYMPILSGDSVYFKLNVSAASGQAAEVDESITISSRVYQIKMNVVGANVWD
jgi:hypothetical protein